MDSKGAKGKVSRPQWSYFISSLPQQGSGNGNGGPPPKKEVLKGMLVSVLLHTHTPDIKCQT